MAYNTYVCLKWPVLLTWPIHSCDLTISTGGTGTCHCRHAFALPSGFLSHAFADSVCQSKHDVEFHLKLWSLSIVPKFKSILLGQKWPNVSIQSVDMFLKSEEFPSIYLTTNTELGTQGRSHEGTDPALRRFTSSWRRQSPMPLGCRHYSHANFYEQHPETPDNSQKVWKNHRSSSIQTVFLGWMVD